MDIPWWTMNTCKFYSKCWRSNLFWEKIGQILQVGACVEVMHKVLLEATKATFAFANFNVVSVDEVTTIDNTQWLSIHLYVVHGWKRIMILLCVEIIGVSSTFDNVFRLMVKGLLEFGGLRFEELAGKLVNMKCDGNNIFQDHRTSVTL